MFKHEIHLVPHHRKNGRQDLPPIPCHFSQPCDRLGELGSQAFLGEAAMEAHSRSQGFLEGRGGISLRCSAWLRSANNRSRQACAS